MFLMNQFLLLLSLYSVTSCSAFESRQKILGNIQDNTHDIFFQRQKVVLDSLPDGENVEVLWINEKSCLEPKKSSNTSMMLNVRNPSYTSSEVTHRFLVRWHPHHLSTLRHLHIRQYVFLIFQTGQCSTCYKRQHPRPRRQRRRQLPP